MNDESLTEEKKLERRIIIVATTKDFLGVKYKFGAEWTDLSKIPERIDCSEFVEGVFKKVGLKMPDGSQNQYNFTMLTENPKPGDLAFFGYDQNPTEIYHVGIVYDDKNIIEARAFDAKCAFKTGEVILRPIDKWRNYQNFCGFRSHPKLI